MADLDARRALIRSNATRTIQRKTRTHIARKHFLALQKATVCMQSACRGRLACKRHDNLRREATSIKILTKWRTLDQEELHEAQRIGCCAADRLAGHGCPYGFQIQETK